MNNQKIIKAQAQKQNAWVFWTKNHILAEISTYNLQFANPTLAKISKVWEDQYKLRNQVFHATKDS